MLLSRLSLLIFILAAILSAWFPSVIMAGNVTLQYKEVSPLVAVNYTLNNRNSSTNAGVFQWNALSATIPPQDDPFYGTHPVGSVVQTFCVELDQYLHHGQTYTFAVLNANQVPSPGIGAGGAMGSAKNDYVMELFGRFYDSSIATDVTKAAAFQLAIWEIVDDSTFGKWDLTQGAFTVNSPSIGARDLAQNWLNALNANGLADPGEFTKNIYLQNRELVGLTSPTAQDQIALIDSGQGVILGPGDGSGGGPGPGDGGGPGDSGGNGPGTGGGSVPGTSGEGIQSVPLPPSLVLAAMGGFTLLGGGWFGKRRRKKFL